MTFIGTKKSHLTKLFRYFQNSTCKSFPWKQAQETETKQSIWRRGFVHLLKKKKLTNFGSGNNNNDADSPSRYRMVNHSTSNSNTANAVNTVINTRNGHARGTYRAIPPSTLDIPATSVEIKWSPAKIVQNNIKTAVDSGSYMRIYVYIIVYPSIKNSEKIHCVVSFEDI